MGSGETLTYWFCAFYILRPRKGFCFHVFRKEMKDKHHMHKGHSQRQQKQRPQWANRHSPQQAAAYKHQLISRGIKNIVAAWAAPTHVPPCSREATGWLCVKGLQAMYSQSIKWRWLWIDCRIFLSKQFATNIIFFLSGLVTLVRKLPCWIHDPLHNSSSSKISTQSYTTDTILPGLG